MIIEDGTGTNNAVKVNEKNQLEVKSESLVSENSAAQRGDSFIVHFECHVAAANSGALMSITNNDQKYDLEVTRIYIDPHTLTPSDLIITQVFDPILSNGTDISSNVIQKNRESSSQFNLTIKASDSSSDLTYTGGVQYHSFPVDSRKSTQRNMNGTNILPKNKTIMWGYKTESGSVATDGEVISLSVNIVKRLKE